MKNKYLATPPRSYVICSSASLTLSPNPLILIHSIACPVFTEHQPTQNHQSRVFCSHGSSCLEWAYSIIIQVANSCITFKSLFKYPIIFPFLTIPLLSNGTLHLVSTVLHNVPHWIYYILYCLSHWTVSSESSFCSQLYSVAKTMHGI